MANLWISRLIILVLCGFSVSNGAEVDSPQMQYPPLLNYGEKLAGDDTIRDSFNAPHAIKLDFNITYFGSSYNHLYISKDGFISFDSRVNYVDEVIWKDGIRNQKADLPFLAPFYHEGYNPASIGIDDYQGEILFRLIYADKLEDAKDDPHYSEKKLTLAYFSQYVQEAVINPPKDFKAELVAVVTWHDITDKQQPRESDCEAKHYSPCKGNTFQVVLIADKENTFAILNYLKMDIPFQKSHQTGFNGGYGRGWHDVVPCHGNCFFNMQSNESWINRLPKEKGTDLVGRYFLNIGQEDVVRGGCLPNSLRAGVLEVFPREVGMFGGEKLEVSGKCLKANELFRCQFSPLDGEPVETMGVMSNDMKGYCPVPLVTTRGPLLVRWSIDGLDWSAEQHITVEMSSKPAGERNGREWENWYKKETSSITVNWSPEMMSVNPSARVEIKLIGYRETNSDVEFKTLATVGETHNSAGSFSFNTENHRCTKNCKDYEMGLFEVGLVKEFYGDATSRVAHRFGPIPLGWYVNTELTDDMGSDWSQQMCRRWYKEDKKDDSWLDRLPKCPCSLDQVLADFGRWQPGGSCNMFLGKECYFHKNAKHCVRSIYPTSEGAGNQCCYAQDGTLMYSQLLFDGSTPDRAHAWGAFPYNKPGRVPSLSHFKHDVVPFLYCCTWNDNDQCELYTKLRPTKDCAKYDVPGLAMVRGDPHFTTFDGLTYNFGGIGDFWLLDLRSISIQGRFMPRRNSWDLGKMASLTSWKPVALTSLTIQGDGEIVEIHPAPENAVRQRGIDIRVGQKRYFFYTDASKWQDFGAGQAIKNNAVRMEGNAHNNFTIFTNGVGIDVVAVNNLLHVTVSLPPSMKYKGESTMGMGLFGTYDGYRNNDLVSKSNAPALPPGTDAQKLFENFGMSWAILRNENLFHFEKDATKMTSYVPYYKYEDIPHEFPEAPSDSQISATCGSNKNCKWDYRITGSHKVAAATREADQLFAYSQGSAYKVESCGLPKIGLLAELNAYNFSVGESITVTGCGGSRSFSGEAKFTCVMETIQQAEDNERLNYGRRVTDNKDEEFIVHWVPQPFEVCSEGSDEASLVMIIGIAVAVLVVILVIVLITCIVLKRRKTKSHKPRAAERTRGGRDEGTDEPMIRDRNPIYKQNRRDQPASSAV